MDEAIMCPECMGILMQPIKLQCRHSFCKSCAVRIYKTTRARYKHPANSFHCPLCETVTILGVGKNEKEPVFDLNLHLGCAVKLAKAEKIFAMRHSSDLEENSSDSEDERGISQGPNSLAQEIQQVPCALCNRPSGNECLNCSLPFCDKCSGFHKANERFRHHKILSYEFMKEIKEPILLDHIKTISQKKLRDEMVKTTCSIHSKEELKWYNLEDRRFLCDSCIKDSEVKVMPISKAIEILKEKADYEQVEKITQGLVKSVSNVESILEVADNIEKRCIEEVAGVFDRIIQKLNDRKAELVVKVSELNRKYKTVLEQQKTEFSILLEKGNMILSQQVAANPVILIRLLERCENFLKMGSNLHQPPAEPLLEINFSEDYVQRVLKSIDMLGDLKTIRSQGETRAHQCLQNSVILPLQAQSIAVMEVLPYFSKAELVYRMSLHGANNRMFHLCCDNKGPLLALAKLKDGTVFGGYTDESWKSVGGWRKAKEAYLFRISDGKGKRNIKRFPIKKSEKANHYAIYLGEKYGLVFGQNDLVLDFDRLYQSKSRLGTIYESFGDTEKLVEKETDWNIVEVEVFSVINSDT